MKKLSRAQEHALRTFYDSYYCNDGLSMGRLHGPDKASVATLNVLIRLGYAYRSEGNGIFPTDKGKEKAKALVKQDDEARG